MATIASITVPPQPTEDYLGGGLRPGEQAVLRFVFFLKYPDGVEKEAADRYFTETFAKEALGQKHLYRFFSYKAVPVREPLPGVWAPEDLGRMKSDSVHDFDRMCEMWYETYED